MFDKRVVLKKLCLIRHAKSDWNNPTLEDFDRPLNHRGRKNAPQMAERWSSELTNVDAWFSSPAERARMTARIFTDTLNITESELQLIDGIYEANYQSLLQFINQLQNELQFVVLFGHNPGFSDLASYLTGINLQLPTCGIVLLEAEIQEWKLLSARGCSLIKLDYPKNEIF